MPLQKLETDYAGRGGALFWLALKTSILTVLTLGFYRFWMKTRLRRYFWSSIRPGGIPLEYTGTGTEKFMGFLIAVVVLAFYIGIVNLVLVFLSYSLFQNHFVAILSTFVGLIPIFFYARYRARRYVIARTRWRGLRLGVDKAAWGYAWRAVLHWILSILTLGILFPRQTFWLEKYLTDRTWFGTRRLTQEGNWRMLLPAATHMYIGLGISATASLGGFFNPVFLVFLPVGVTWFLIGLVYFRVEAFAILSGNKRLGEKIGFRARPSTWRIIRIYFVGYLLIGLSLTLSAFAFFFIAALAMSQSGFDALVSGGVTEILKRENISGLFLVAVAAFSYFSFFILYGVLSQVFITLPVVRHYAHSVVILNGQHLAEIPQRPRDEMEEAEGFADALDIGAAI